MEFSNGHEELNKKHEQVNEQPQIEEQEVRQGFNINNYVRDLNEVFFTIDEHKYSIIPLTLEEEARLSYLYKDEEGKVLPELSRIVILTKLNIVPYTSNDIKQVIDKHKEWSELEYQDRFNFLKKMQTSYLINLINAYVDKSGEKEEREEVKK